MGKSCKVVVCGQASVGKTSILEQLLYGNHVVGELLGMSCGGGSRSTKRFDHNTKRLKVAPGGAPRIWKIPTLPHRRNLERGNPISEKDMKEKLASHTVLSVVSA